MYSDSQEDKLADKIKAYSTSGFCSQVSMLVFVGSSSKAQWESKVFPPVCLRPPVLRLICNLNNDPGNIHTWMQKCGLVPDRTIFYIHVTQTVGVLFFKRKYLRFIDKGPV